MGGALILGHRYNPIKKIYIYKKKVGDWEKF
jgi:hypothetical protein